MLVHCSNCEVGYVHEAITHLDISLVTNCSNRWLCHAEQSLGCAIDGKSTGRSRQRHSARPSGAGDAKRLTVTVADVVELTK